MIRYYCDFCGDRLSPDYIDQLEAATESFLGKKDKQNFVDDIIQSVFESFQQHHENRDFSSQSTVACRDCLDLLRNKRQEIVDALCDEFIPNWREKIKREIELHRAKRKKDKAKILLHE